MKIEISKSAYIELDIEDLRLLERVLYCAKVYSREQEKQEEKQGVRNIHEVGKFISRFEEKLGIKKGL